MVVFVFKFWTVCVLVNKTLDLSRRYDSKWLCELCVGNVKFVRCVNWLCVGNVKFVSMWIGYVLVM
jgi:hypothetical protein